MLKFLFISLVLQLPIKKMPLPTHEIRDSTKNFIVLHNDGSNSSAKVTHRTLKRRKLSYHYFIDKDGDIYEFVNPTYIAKHAGVSLYNGHIMWNNFSIGICLQGKTGFRYTQKQYDSLNKLITYLHTRYTDSKSKPLLTHSQIAFPWGRKRDPGATFNFDKLKVYK